MNLRWLRLDHFPRDLKLTREERRVTVKLGRRLRRRRPNYVGAERRLNRWWTLVMAIGLMTIATVDLTIAGFRSNPDALLRIIIASIAVTLVAMLYLECRTEAPFTRRALRVMGHDVCVKCGYLHTGLRSDIKSCPECGAERDDNCPRCGMWHGGLTDDGATCPQCQAQIRRPESVDPGIHALRDMGYDICPRCGHWLRESIDDQPDCPSCQLPRKPPVGDANSEAQS